MQLDEFYKRLLTNEAESKDIVSYIRIGVPDELRGQVWMHLSGAESKELESKYLEYLKESSECEKQIQRDLHRTFPDHERFQNEEGKRSLFNVAKVYSLFDKEVGYCQGLSFITGPLVLNLSDSQAFCLLVKILNDYGIRGHYTQTMEGLHVRMHQFDKLFMEHHPIVFRHMEKEGIKTSMYATQWFMTLFAYKFPMDIVFRILDLFLVEGGILFLISGCYI